MKALVTGGAGFIGSHLVEALLERQHDVVVMDNLSSGKKGHVPSSALLYVCDITSPHVKAIMKTEKPDVVFHLAAQADVQRSIDNPAFDADVNIVGTIRLLEACREAGVGKFVFASTSGVYGNLHKELMNETDPVYPISFYGQSKAACETYIRLFHELFGLPFTILRYGNVYGPRQTAKGEGGVIAVYMDRVKSGQPLSVHGDGAQTRDFVYVKDVVSANIAAMVSGSGETVHVSTGMPTSINEVVELISGIHGSPVAAVHTPARAGDIRHSCLSPAKAKETLSWQPQFAIREGLRLTYTEWMS